MDNKQIDSLTWRRRIRRRRIYFFAQKPNIKINKHVNKVRKATGRAEAITAGRHQNKHQYLIIQLMKKRERIKTGQERQQSHYTKNKIVSCCIPPYYNHPNILVYW